MKEIIIKIINKSNNPTPKYATKNSAGFDLYSNNEEDIILKNGEISLIPTGIYMEIPLGYEGQIRARSGLALKHGLCLVNGVGTIDSDYRGEIKIIMTNLSKKDFSVSRGMKIAQMVMCEYVKADFAPCDSLEDTHRGKGGFGHSGI